MVTRAYSIAFQLLIVLAVMNCLVVILPLSENLTFATSAAEKMTDRIEEMGNTLTIDEDIGIISFSAKLLELLFYSIMFIVIIMFQSTILLPLVLHDIGLHVAFNSIITTGVWCTYVYGAVNYWSNRPG